MSCINLWDTACDPVVLSPCSFLLLILFSKGILFVSGSSGAKINLKHFVAAKELRM